MVRSAISAFVVILLITVNLSAGEIALRWTGAQDSQSDFQHLLDTVNAKSKLKLKATDFLQIEDRDLANNHFTMWVQTFKGLPVSGMSLRRWTDLKDQKAVQVEAFVTDPSQLPVQGLQNLQPFSADETMALVRPLLTTHTDTRIRSVTWRDQWEQKDIVREVQVKAAYGTHTIRISLTQQKVLSTKYREYPQGEVLEYHLPALVFPIWEEYEGQTSTLAPRVPGMLKYLNTHASRPSFDPYANLAKGRRFLEEKLDPVLGSLPEGQKQGYWSMAFVKDLVRKIFQQLPKQSNDFSGKSGVILDGRYATVNLHPDVVKAFKGLKFNPGVSAQFRPNWVPTPENPDKYEMIPTGTLLGRPMMRLNEAETRPARRLSDHNPVEYINDGFDEVQVYWAITQMFDSLRPMGFSDPELSTRRFDAFLFDPDISMRDNAYYTDDTINFTTYSSNNPNFARDNSTIWHELGHGVMDRLMGPEIRLADTGGLSEGMADFVAQMVINDVTQTQDFEGRSQMRIFNNTGFFLTSESHDDGEAYGGAMNDLMQASIKKHGQEGVRKITDLTLEAMRLSRNHPHLTAQDWFSRMLFADELGSNVRKPSELRDLITGALESRNFSFDGQAPAQLVVTNGKEEITSDSLGSRYNPIKLKLKQTESSSYQLNVQLKNSAHYKFKFPVTVKVFFKEGALQGAVHWVGEEKGPLVVNLQNEADLANIDLTATGQCDFINREDNSCQDYAYVQIWNAGETWKAQAKKRFYLRIYPQK